MLPAFIIATLIGVLCCGLTLDVGVLQYTRLRMQRAADAACVGAQVSHDQEDANWMNNGLLDSAQNGFTNAVNNTTVTVSEQPVNGAYAGRYDAIQATVSSQVQTIFMGSFNGGKQLVTVQATALMTPCVYLANAKGIAYALKLMIGSSIGYWGGSSMGCPVYVNGGVSTDSNSALWVNATNATGASTASSLAGGAFHPPQFNSRSQADPLAYSPACSTLTPDCIRGISSGLQAPSFSKCTFTNKTWPSGTVSLSPGTYCSSFSFANATVTLSPGLYIITNGGTWTNSSVSGNGVTLYFTQKGDGQYGTFQATSSPSALSAPTVASNGSIPAILWMNDPNWVAKTAQDFSFTSGSGNTGDGIFYIVQTGLYIDSSYFSAIHYLSLDVDNLVVSRSAITPKSNFSPVPTGNPFSPAGSLVQ